MNELNIDLRFNRDHLSIQMSLKLAYSIFWFGLSFDVWVGLVVGPGLPLVAPLHSTKKAAEEKSEREVGAEKRGKDGKQSTVSNTVLSFYYYYYIF